MHLDRVGSVFQIISHAHLLPGKFSRLADKRKALFQGMGEDGSKDETPRFDPYHSVDGLALIALAKEFDDPLKGIRILKEWSDILKEDSWFGKIRNVTDEFFNFFHREG